MIKMLFFCVGDIVSFLCWKSSCIQAEEMGSNEYISSQTLA